MLKNDIDIELCNNDIMILDNIIFTYMKNNSITDSNFKLNDVSSSIFKDKLLNINSFKKTQILKRLKKIKKYRKTLAILKNLPLVKQRTPEWFDLRKNRLTASDLYDAINKKNDALAKKKAGIIIDNTNFNNVPPLKWGTMFEPMATRCYSQKNNNIIVNEFGLIADKKLEHFGASPDGINENGIMIEIKCPYSRKIIDKFIPPKYYLQIQGQLAVCELEECDYIECNFKLYNSIEEYLLNDVPSHGIIAEYKTVNSNEYYYIYSDENMTTKEAYDNINNYINQKKDDRTIIFIKLIPWKLEEMIIQKVFFDEKEWSNIIPKINTFWEKVENCRGLPIEYKNCKENTKYAYINDDEDNEKKDNSLSIKKFTFIPDDD